MATLSPDRILREIEELWTATGKESQTEVLRACSMTLIVVADGREDAGLTRTIEDLMPEHPARTILIRLTGGGERALAESVYPQCWMPFGERRQICCEHIRIEASDASIADLPPVLLPLLAPDLPTILWWRCPRLFDAPAYHAIAAMARKTVVDSDSLPEPRAALGALARMAREGKPVADLSWTLLTRWREMLSRVFENREYQARLPQVSSLRVSFAGDRAPVSVWYMGAWVAEALAGVGVRLQPAFETRAGLTGRGLRVELEGGGFTVALERQNDLLSVQTGDLSYCANMPKPTDYTLMREELGIIQRDPVFERTLAAAAKLAGA